VPATSSFRQLDVWQEAMILVEEIAKRLGSCVVDDYRRIQERVDRVGRMLNGLIESLQPREEHSISE